MTKPSLKVATRTTLTTWRKILALAEKGEWQKAYEYQQKREAKAQEKWGESCGFCALSIACSKCPVDEWCRRDWSDAPSDVFYKHTTPAEGLRRIRIIVAGLEKIEGGSK